MADLSKLAAHFLAIEKFRRHASGEFSTDHWSVLPIAEEIARRENLRIQSCLDIGSGVRPKHEWFNKAFGGDGIPIKFCALESDSKLRAKLADMKVEVESDFSCISDRAYDMSIALEVVEHLKPEDSVEFLLQAARVTEHMFCMTVPNFEYWNERLRAKPRHKDVRWIPDHFVAYDPGSNDPHKHKQMTSPATVGAYLEQSFPRDDWDFEVIRAWPWDLKDRARGITTTYYFKVFALAIRR